MNKILRSTIAAAVSAFIFAGCSVPGITSNNNNGDNMTDSYNYSPTETGDAEQVYSWLIQPSIQADNIISFDASTIDPDNADNRSYINYSVIRQNGKYGLIDYAGNYIIKPAYEDYYVCSCGEIVLLNIIDERNEEYEYCTIDKDRKISSTPQHTVDDSPQYFLDIKSQKVFEGKHGSKSVTEYTGKKTVPVTEANVEMDDYGNLEVSVPDGALCGLAKSGKLLTDMVYTAFYAPSYKGVGSTLVAFRNEDDKWGYLDTDGNVVIDFICDGDPNAYNGMTTDDPAIVHPYLFCDDYVPIYKDGYYSYYDFEGNQVVRAGEFAQARPINNGRAWVKQNDFWGVIQMGDIIEEEKPKDDSSSMATTTSGSTYWTATTSDTTESQPEYTDWANVVTDEYGNVVTTPSEWTDPNVTEPALTDPVDPGYTDPVTPDPGYTDPVTPDPGYVDPAPIDPGYTDPAPADPAY
ncbi:hypothetical protein RASY3_01390 [Ruminococcus albus SY3]|uniref:WG repeat-containing protein n=1 Tax=Ruminococcus albus SY3 TaxID=1341156 RepID=A0A011WU73_RUMAL|nr:WG repeat-containing protein [Ruminococcus albus]EXM40540.1 hypothetical protein RASY3_01390 [Ruminococcus albus SY3]